MLKLPAKAWSGEETGINRTKLGVATTWTVEKDVWGNKYGARCTALE